MGTILSRGYWAAYERFLVDSRLRHSTTRWLETPRHDPSRSAATEDLLRGTIRRRSQNGTLPHAFAHLDIHAPYDELVEQWRDLPIMSREDMQSISDHTERSRGSSVVRTGGSTGEPVEVVISRQGFHGKRARLLATRTAIGWRPGMHTFSVWGSESDIGKSESVRSRVQRRAASLHFDGGFTSSAQRWHRLADRMEERPNGLALYGYSSLLGDFARTLQADGRQLREGLITSLWNGAEAIDDGTRSAIETTTGTKLHNFYGARETGAIAVELHRASSPGLTVAGPEIVLEIVDEVGSHVADGEVGRVLVSLLTPSGTPVLRYEIGDLARAGAVDGFGCSTLLELVGRSNDQIPLAGGEHVSGLFFNHLIKEFPTVAQFQARVDTSARRIELLVILVDHEVVESRLESLAARVAAKVAGYQVDVTPVHALIRTPQGKLRQVIVQ